MLKFCWKAVDIQAWWMYTLEINAQRILNMLSQLGVLIEVNEVAN